jgi:GNAT superfamily N-acetyltransferase
MSYDIVSYTPELDTQIAELHRHLGNSDAARNATYLRWKYADNPFLAETLIYVALCEGRAIGMRGMFGTLWQVDDDASRHLLPYADDLVVAPEHRNRGVVSLIMNAAVDDLTRRGFPFAISLSAGPVTYVASLALGWRSAGSFEPVRRSDNPQQSGQWPRTQSRALAARMPLLRRWAQMIRAQRTHELFHNLDREGGANQGAISVSDSPRSDAMAALVERLPWDGRIRHVRDARYFAWRFRNPRHEYRFLFSGGQQLQGYLVLQRCLPDQSDLERVNIIDWEATDEQVRADLLAAALRWGRFRRVHAWMASAGDSTRALLLTHGFETDPDRVRGGHQGLLVRRVSDRHDTAAWHLGRRELLKIDDWDIRMLYSMAG